MALTADITEENQVKCQSAGFDRVLSKPIRKIDLQKVINSIFKVK